MTFRGQMELAPSRNREETADLSTTLPQISCETWWRWQNFVRLSLRKAAYVSLRVPRGRKSGYAPVEMTNLLSYVRSSIYWKNHNLPKTNLSSRPERSRWIYFLCRPVLRGDREWIVGNSYVRVVRYPGKGEPLRDTSARQRRHPYGWRPVVFIELRTLCSVFTRSPLPPGPAAGRDAATLPPECLLYALACRGARCPPGR
jgi:hypothetical protein